MGLVRCLSTRALQRSTNQLPWRDHLILRDIQCELCGTVTERMMRSCDTIASVFCDRCCATTKHHPLCNGGCRYRYRINDWSGYDATGAFEASGDISVTEADGTTSLNTDGTPTAVACRSKYHQDYRSERREQLRFARSKRDGKLPVRVY